MFDEVFNQSTDTKKNDSNKERINRWRVGLELFFVAPTFGIGMGTYPDKYLDAQTIDMESIDENYLTENRMNLHNIFLGWMVEGGIITFFAGLSMLFYFFWWLTREVYRGKYSFLKILLLLYMTSFVFHGFFHDFTQNARIIIPFWVCMAIVSRQMNFEKKLKI
jgi:O-antigen ligase